MRMTSELMQFEIGTSTSRYFPPNGTAGFDRWAVSGNSRLPAPPPRITARRLCFEGIRMGRGYKESSGRFKLFHSLVVGQFGKVARASRPWNHAQDARAT